MASDRRARVEAWLRVTVAQIEAEQAVLTAAINDAQTEISLELVELHEVFDELERVERALLVLVGDLEARS